MGGVVAGVEHGHRDAAAGVAPAPHLGGVDLRHRVLEVHRDATVQVDARGAVGEAGRGAGGAAAGRDVVPEGRGASLGDTEGRHAEPGHRHGAAGRGRCGRPRLAGRGGSGAVVDDHRQRAGRPVVVLLPHQPGDVEQVQVQPLGGEQRDRGTRHDVQVVPGLGDRGLRQGAVGVRLQRHGPASAGPGGHERDVTGDQRDPGGRRQRGGALRRARRGRGRRGRRRQGETDERSGHGRRHPGRPVAQPPPVRACRGWRGWRGRAASGGPLVAGLRRGAVRRPRGTTDHGAAGDAP